MCDYQGYEFGASYPDSVCIDGKLYDADYCDDEGRLFDNGLDAVCPICDKQGAIDWWYERYENSCHPDDCNPETEKDWAEINAYHMANAMHLVADIRKNRGIIDEDIPERLKTIAISQDWSISQIKAAAKAAIAGRSIGWQIAVARRAGYGF